MKASRALVAVAVLTCSACAPEKGADIYGVDNAKAGADFRASVQLLLAEIEPPCVISEKPEVVAKLNPAKSRFANLETRLAATKGAIDIAIARSDYIAQMPVYECIAPDLSGAEAKMEKSALYAEKLIQDLETISAATHSLESSK